MRPLAVIALAACGSASPSAPPTSAPTASAPVPASARDAKEVRATELARRAEDILISDAPANYELPFANKFPERPHALAALLEACDADHRPSCWKAWSVAQDADKPRIAQIVAENCRVGDRWSCRALPRDTDETRVFPDVRGAEGRSTGCEQFPPAETCDDDVLRRECDDGFPASCAVLSKHSRDDKERETLLARAAELRQEGCTRDILDECRNAKTWPDDARLDAAQRRCKLDRYDCLGLARLLEQHAQTTAALSEKERACQYGREWGACIEVAVSYLDRKHEEPAPGRGEKLLDWSCREVLRILRSRERDLFQHHPECKRASLK